MKKVKIIFKNETGLHLRPVSKLVKQASKYKANISLIKENQKYNVKSVMGILNIGLLKGDTLMLEAQGEDEEEAVLSLSEIIKNIE